MVVIAIAAASFSRASGVLRKLRGGGRSQKIRWSLAFEAERSLASQAPSTRLLPRRMQASAGRRLAASRIARAISIHRMPLSSSFKFAGDGDALLNAPDLAISLYCASLHSRILTYHLGPQSYQHASGQESVELGLRHAILHRSGKTAARPGAIRRRSDWSPVTPSLSQPGSHLCSATQAVHACLSRRKMRAVTFADTGCC